MDRLIEAIVRFGVISVFITEILSLFGAIERVPLTLAYLIAVAAGVWHHGGIPRPRLPYIPKDWLVRLCMAATTLIAVITFVLAVASPPNSADAMAYHMPRVVYWAQQHSVAPFPTSYFNQVAMQPFAEYWMLAGYVITGTDRLANLGQWVAMCGSVGAVILLARSFGVSERGRWIAALFCATLPNGILQASGAKNDYILALWLVAAAYFLHERHWWSGSWATALALGTKATGYLFLPAVLIATRRRPPAAMLLCVLLLNGPQYLRNWSRFGNPIGPGAAQADGQFRWLNEKMGWRQTLSNLLRHGSEQAAGRSSTRNQAVYEMVVGLHQMLRIDPQDPNTTWRWTNYAPPRNANHEANAANRWHLLVILIAAVFLSRTLSLWTWYSAGLAVSLIAFCALLKWQPFLSRLFLPLFVLSAPMAGALAERFRPSYLQWALCLFLLNNARPYLEENWTRPLTGDKSVFTLPRNERYFADMNQWNNRESYERAASLTVDSTCQRIGVDITRNHVEYPFLALVRHKRPAARFQHVERESPEVCAVLCLDCASSPERRAAYSGMRRVEQIGQFLLFTR